MFHPLITILKPLNTHWAENTELVMFIVQYIVHYENIQLFSGINILIPVLDKVKYVQSLKEIAIDIPQQTAISSGQWAPFLTKERHLNFQWCHCCL